MFYDCDTNEYAGTIAICKNIIGMSNKNVKR